MKWPSDAGPPSNLARGIRVRLGALYAAFFLLLPILPAYPAETGKAAQGGDATPKIAHVFFAQQHVQSPDSPHFKLVGNLETLVKVHVSGRTGSPSPEARARLALGGEALDLPLKGPGLLPGPVAGNPALLEHNYEDSFTAVIPRKWVRTGLKVEVELRARGSSGDITVLERKVFDPLPVGAPTRLILTMFDFHFFEEKKNADYPKGWFEELGSKLPVAELELRRVRNIVLDKIVKPPLGENPAACYSSRPKEGFGVELRTAAYWNGALKEAAGAGWGGVRRLYYSNLYGIPPKGEGGGLSGKGNGEEVGILLHELGHAFGLPHWGDSKEYPYVGPMHGIRAETGQPHVGPVWAFDPVRREFISPILNGAFKHDPMWGGGANRSGGPYGMEQFSDYSVSRIRECLESTQVVWDAKDGNYKSWDQKSGSYSTTARPRGGPNSPVEDDIDVISVLACASLVTPEANLPAHRPLPGRPPRTRERRLPPLPPDHPGRDNENLPREGRPATGRRPQGPEDVRRIRRQSAREGRRGHPGGPDPHGERQGGVQLEGRVLAGAQDVVRDRPLPAGVRAAHRELETSASGGQAFGGDPAVAPQAF
jgi:hypothetical protein